MNRGRTRLKAPPPNDREVIERGTMKALVTGFIRDEQGQDLVEYALIVAAVGLALITTVNQLSQGIVSLYQSMTGDLSSIGAQQ
jgi:Flp pilus assembly pilin Flp